MNEMYTTAAQFFYDNYCPYWDNFGLKLCFHLSSVLTLQGNYIQKVIGAKSRYFSLLRLQQTRKVNL